MYMIDKEKLKNVAENKCDYVFPRDYDYIYDNDAIHYLLKRDTNKDINVSFLQEKVLMKNSLQHELSSGNKIL